MSSFLAFVYIARATRNIISFAGLGILLVVLENQTIVEPLSSIV